MSRYGPLYSFRIEHEYFLGNTCRGLTCDVSPPGLELLSQRGLLLRQVAENEWTVFYDQDNAGADFSTDVLTLGMKISAPAFVLYTAWGDFDPNAAYRLELPTAAETVKATDVITKISDKRKMGEQLFTIEIRLNDDIWNAAESNAPKRDTITFQAVSRTWEYLFIKSNNKSVVPDQLKLEADKDIIKFKPFEVVQEFGREVYLTVSEEEIPMRENYDAKLNLVMIPESTNRQKLVFMRNVPHPEPGRFKVEKGKIRQVCYF